MIDARCKKSCGDYSGSLNFTSDTCKKLHKYSTHGFFFCTPIVHIIKFVLVNLLKIYRLFDVCLCNVQESQEKYIQGLKGQKR